MLRGAPISLTVNHVLTVAVVSQLSLKQDVAVSVVEHVSYYSERRIDATWRAVICEAESNRRHSSAVRHRISAAD